MRLKRSWSRRSRHLKRNIVVKTMKVVSRMIAADF